MIWVQMIWVQRLGWTLLHFLWQGTAILIVYAALRSFLPRRAQARYLLACLTLAAMVLAPPLTFLFIPRAGIGAPVSVTVSSEWQRILPGVVALWLLGVLFFSIRLYGGWRFAASLRSAAYPAAEEWQQALERIAVRFGASRPVRLLISSLVNVPTVIGWLRPVILVPAECLTGLPIAHVTALLAHEMAHIRRNDYLASILQSIAEAVLFYHPAVWWVSEQIRAERELCCDDLAVIASGDAFVYAQALAQLESQRRSLQPALAANGGSLVNRIRRLIEPANTVADNLPGPGAAWAMTLLWLVGAGVAAVHAAQAPPVVTTRPTPATLTGRARNALLFDPLLAAQSPQPPADAVPVVVSKAKRATVPVYLRGLGNVTPSNRIALKPRVDGQIMSVNFQEGDLVQKDQVLFTIDPRPYEVMLSRAEGDLARDQAKLTDAQRDLGIYQNQARSGTIPQSQADSQAALIAQLEGTLQADKAAVNSAKLQLVYCKVSAPFAGRIGLRLVDAGNVVNASDPTGLAVIVQVQPITVVFTVPEDYVRPVMRKLRNGPKLPVEAWNRDNSSKLATGSLVTVDNEIDVNTGTSKLKAVFPNSDEELFPNQFVNVRLLIDEKPDQIVIPSAAIQHGAEGAFVYVVGDNNRAQRRSVTPDTVVDGTTTAIAKGLKDGESVVVEGIGGLRNNTQVLIR